MRLNEIRFSSFYIGNDLVNRYNRIFFKIDEQWFETVVSEGKLTILSIDEPFLKTASEIEDEFKYTITQLFHPFFDENIERKEVVSIARFVLKTNNDVDVGLKVILNNGSSIIVYDDPKNEQMDLVFDRYIVSEDVEEFLVNSLPYTS